MRVWRRVRTSGTFGLIGVLIVGLFAPSAVVHALGGAGTSGSPYQITSCDDFLDIENDYDAYYILMNDIDCSADGDSFTVGDNVLAFSGHFNGNHKTITIDINNTNYPYDVAGIFNYSAGAVISDLTIAGSITTDVSTGALSGFDEFSTISNVIVTAMVSGGDSTGGLIGEMDNSTISAIRVTGSVTGGNTVGGVVGVANASSIEDVLYSGEVVATGSVAGGLVGYAGDTFLRRSGTTGSVAGGDAVGGAVGRTDGITAVDQIYSTSDVTGFQYVGGIIGQMLGTSSIQDSYARGDITATYYAAGVVGAAATSEISNVYATGLISSSPASGILSVDTGGSTIIDSFWNVYGGTNPLDTGGTFRIGLVGNQSTDAMTLYRLYSTHPSLSAPWDFNTVWGMNETDNDGYPFLLWQGWVNDPPRDRDGIPSTIEDAAPNHGDANNDGTPDAEQDYVTSLRSTASNAYVTAVVDSECVFQSVSSSSEATNTTADAGFSYPAGFVHFAADCAATPYTANVQIYMYGLNDVAVPVVRKYKPSTGAYFTIPDAAFTKQAIGDTSAYVTSYQIADGGPLDIDGTADGIITDPVGLGVAVVSAPNTGLGGLERQ
jgi:hypothetical protein